MTVWEKSSRLVRRAGPNPVTIGTEVGHRLTAAGRQRRLRRAYDARVRGGFPPAQLVAPRIGLCDAGELPPALAAAAERLRAEADAVVAHTMDYLGSGQVALGPQIDWHRDFKSGYRWPADFYQDVEVTRLDDESDAKVPWELSRGHHLLTLARAARLWRSDHYALELERQLADWIVENPTGRGVNWTNPMEIALRAVNWLWAVGTVEELRPLEPRLRERVTRALQAHGRHVAANLEGSPALRSNHYLANVLGLLLLAGCLKGDPATRRWRRFARREMERQILRQVHDDGVGFEASLPYHGLALEMFLLGWHVSALAGQPFSERYRQRLRRMLEVTRAVRLPDGRTPVFGDQDSGRVLPAGFARPPTQDHLLDLGAALLGGPRALEDPPHEEVAWMAGLGAWNELARRPVESRPIRTAFPDGGIYVMDSAHAKLVARWGGVGQNGLGGHAHNDVGSFELWLGDTLVVDPGTYVYTADPAARDKLRSARAHNVLVVDGLEMHPIPNGRPFELIEHARVSVERVVNEPTRLEVTASHDGFRRPGRPLLCRRSITIDRPSGAVHVTDEINGSGDRRALESFLHLSPRVRVERVGASALDLSLGQLRARVVFEGAAAVEVESGWVSAAYGIRERAPVIRATAIAAPPATIAYRIEPGEEVA